MMTASAMIMPASLPALISAHDVDGIGESVDETFEEVEIV